MNSYMILLKKKIFKIITHFSNLLLPEGKFTERQKAKYMFDIYCCKNLIDKPSNIVRERLNIVEELKVTGPTTFVEVSFAGVSVSLKQVNIIR